MSEESEKQIGEMHEKLALLYDRLYGTNGHTGDIAELKAGVQTALDKCHANEAELSKFKNRVYGAMVTALTGLGSSLAAIFK